MALGMPRGLPGSCASCAGPAIRGEGRHGTLEQSRRQQLRGKAPSCAPFSLGGHKLPHQALGARETEAGGRGGPDVSVADYGGVARSSSQRGREEESRQPRSGGVAFVSGLCPGKASFGPGRAGQDPRERFGLQNWAALEIALITGQGSGCPPYLIRKGSVQRARVAVPGARAESGSWAHSQPGC